MTSLLIKSGSCHGLSKEVNLGIRRFTINDQASFKRISKCLIQVIDLRILEKPVLEGIEKKMEKYLRSFLKWKNNVISLELVSSQQIEKSMKVDLADCVQLL